MRKTILPALPLLALCGCAANLAFDSPSPLGAGVSGKYWQTPYYVDAPLYIPGAQSTTILNNSFAATVSGTSVQLVGNWWDSSTVSAYHGYARLYQDGTGWSALGPNFGQLATDSTSTNTFGLASIAAGPGGTFMASFFESTGTIAATAAYNGISWQSTINASPALTSLPAANTNAPSVVDQLGRGYVFFYDGASVQVSQWAAIGGLAPTAVVNTTALNPNTHLSAKFDGSKQVCVMYETGGFNLIADCQDVTQAGPYTFSNGGGVGITATSIDSGVAGHSLATDGAGNMMAVYYKGGDVWGVLGVNGVWQTPVKLDVLKSTDGYSAPVADTTIWPNGEKPGVAYVGSGRFLAAWIGINKTLQPPATQIYSMLYDPAVGGWEGPQSPSLPGTLQVVGPAEPYNLIPHHQALTVFGNGAGNGGLAINTIYTDDTIAVPIPTVSASALYPEAAQARIVKLGRWQQDNGWINIPLTSFAPLPPAAGALPTFSTPATPSFICFNAYDTTILTQASSNPTPSGGGADCTAYPVAAILPSGDTLVFFQAEDNYPSGSGPVIPGNRRIAVTEFK